MARFVRTMTAEENQRRFKNHAGQSETALTRFDRAMPQLVAKQ